MEIIKKLKFMRKKNKNPNKRADKFDFNIDLLPLYVCHRCLNKVLEYNQKGTFGGEIYFMTIMFVDIRGFTTMSEKIGAEDAMRVLNSNYQIMIDAVFQHDGAVIKFLGDGMLCAFGLPNPKKNDADHAFDCAIQLQREMEKFQINQESDRRVKIGIGIHSGKVILGNIGHKQRLDFTIIGDAVNTASRLQDNARSDEILVSKNSLSALSSDKSFETKFIEIYLPKGKTQPIEVYKLIW